jgi:tetratricopeptide (TPR) repeat protein
VRGLAYLWWKVFAALAISNYLPGLVINFAQGGLPALWTSLTTWGLLQPLEEANPPMFWGASGVLAALAIVGASAELSARIAERRQRDADRKRLHDAHTKADKAHAAAVEAQEAAIEAVRVAQLTGKAPLMAVDDLEPLTFQMGDSAAANFPFIAAPVQQVFDEITRALHAAADEEGAKSGVLIVGPANAGKTRLAYEAIRRTLPEWWVVRWNEAYKAADLPSPETLHERDIVFFIDDLQEYAPGEGMSASAELLALANRAPSLREAVQLARQTAHRVVVVAACRAESQVAAQAELGWLFEELKVIDAPRFSPDETQQDAARAIKAFTAAGAQHADEWDGTLGSLVLGLARKREQYMQLVNAGDLAATVLRAMKLLTLANATHHSARRVRAVCAQVFGESALADNEKAWRAAVETLTTKEFVIENVGTPVDNEVVLVILKDPAYFEQVIQDYPDPKRPAQLLQDIAKLGVTLAGLQDTSGLCDLGQAYLNLRRPDEAAAVCDQAIALYPEPPELVRAWRTKGVALARLQNLDGALDAYDRALDIDPKDAHTWLNKGATLSNKGLNEEAVEACKTATSLDPRDARAWFNLSAVQARLGHTDKALEAAQKAIDLNSRFAAPWSVKGNALLALKRVDEAREAYEHGLELEPQDASLLYNLSTVLERQRDYGKARELLDQALALGPQDAPDLKPVFARAWREKGMELAGLEGDDAATRAFAALEQALALEPQNAATWYNKSVLLGRLKQDAAALEAVEQALALDTEHTASWRAQALHNRGASLGHLGRDEEALEAYEEALALEDPQLAPTWYNKGLVCTRLERYEEALEAFSRALEIDPQYAPAWRKKGAVLWNVGRNEEALEAEARATELGD